MYRTSFRSPEDGREALLDALLPLLPTGVHEGPDTLSVISGAALDRAVLEAAAGHALEGWGVEEVAADWRHRRGEEGVLIGGRVCIRSPFDPPPGEGIVDVVVERRGSAFGSGSHPTTQMCVSLMLELSPEGGAADLGCGVGTLAIVAAKLGWAPVVGVDRVPVAIEVGRENVERNGVEVSLTVADLAADAVPLAPLLLVNAPPPVQERVVASMTRRGPARDRVRDRGRGGAGGGARLPVRRVRGGAGAGDGGRVDRVAAELLSPDRAAAEGAALGQLACALPAGGLLITASRLVEFGARAAILLAPGLFRLDLTPREETLGLYPRALCEWEVEWRAGEDSWDGYRDPKGPGPIELLGLFDVPGGPLRAWVHVLSFTERDALATHFVAKCEITWTSKDS